MRLRDLFVRDAAGRRMLTWRELASYVSGLPPDSATRTALNDGVLEPTGEQVILADIFDAVSQHDWHFAVANSEEKKPKPKKPRPYPRWWAQKKPRHSPQRVAKIEDARRRKREREQAIAEGRIA